MGLDRAAPPHADRVARYGAVSTALALLSDRRLGRLVDGAALIGSGIGGTTMALDVDGTPVFVKRIPLTDVERRPENVRSTANLFGLPTYCHYGLGSPGGGAWRELAAQVMTTGWVLARQCESFPLTYHWRVLDGPPPRPRTAAERAERAGSVAFWHDSPAVRDRLEAIAGSTASLVLFLEFVPQNLHEWLTAQFGRGDDAAGAACARVERGLRIDVEAMNSSGLLHFDAHFRNILTDGHRLYFADFGLATSPRFELSGAERSFVRRNASHDAGYTQTQLVNWLVTTLTGAVPEERNRIVRRWAAGDRAFDATPPVAAVLDRHAPIAAVLNDFYWRLYSESRAVPYPAEEVCRVHAAAGRRDR